MQDALQRYLDTNKMYHFEGEPGVAKMEKVMKDVCGYAGQWGGTMQEFFADNPGAIQAVIEWIGNVRVTEWKDNLEAMVGPDEEDEVGDLAPPDEATNEL